jgi:hypothetical protein
MKRIHVSGALIVTTILACGEPTAPPPATERQEEALVKGGNGNSRRRNFVGTFKPATAVWTLARVRPGWEPGPNPPANQQFTYGSPNDTPLVGDWNGDGTETQGIWQRAHWFLSDILGNSSHTVPEFVFGNVDDVPIVGDWDGNGTATAGVFRQGTFFLRNSNTTGNADISFSFGSPGDIPVVGDWDGDGTETVGVYKPAQAKFFLINQHITTAAADVQVVFGSAGAGDRPIIGDWDEDGVSTIGIRRGTNFLLRNRNTDGFASTLVSLGSSGDVPVAGNWDPNATPAFPPPPIAATFPIGVDFQPPCRFQTWKDRGVNFVIRTPDVNVLNNEPAACRTMDWTATAKSKGLKMIRHWISDADNNDPDILAWHMGDEWDNLGRELDVVRQDLQNRSPIQFMTDQLNLFRSKNASRPISINFNGKLVVQPVESSGKNDPCDGRGDYGSSGNACYPRLLPFGNWIMNDIYPIADSVNHQDPGLHGTAAALDKLRRWKPGQPQFAYIQTGRMNALNANNHPDPAATRGLIWSAIIHGAGGIIYFPLNGCDGPCTQADDTQPAMATEITAQNSRITAMSAVLRSAMNPSSLGFRGKLPLQATWREFGGKRYFFVLNFSNSTVTQRMTISGFTPSAALIVEGENRQIGAAGQNTLTDTFAPYQLHIYRTQ